MAWDESRHGLGVPEMDDTHREFVGLVYGLLIASDEDFPALFRQLQAHTIQHFEHEGKLMKACRFSAIGEHNSEHLRVLGELAHFARSVTAGRLGMARDYVRNLLPGWFATHLATMDSALAGCLKRR